MSGSGEDGPQSTAAAAYAHAAEMAAAIANQARHDAMRAGQRSPVFVRVERVEHLAAGLQARAEEAER